ncbi:MAG: PKD domain-containing protein, partial [Candidatus Sumerlaeaceae bacterium]|nr:PKD domain-containing protein [Candidatus Sumerlaeaceae bacterium]
RPPDRKISIVAPPHGASLTYDVPVRFEARPEGVGVKAVEWLIVDSASSTVLERTKVPATPDGNPLFEHTIAEASGVKSVTVVARAVTDGAAAPAEDSVSYRLVAPERKIALTQPARRTQLVLGQPVQFEARTEGPGLDAIEWVFEDAVSGRLLKQEKIPVTPAGTASITHVVEEELGVQEVRVAVRGLAKSGLPVTEDRAVYTYTPPAREVRIVQPADNILFYEQPVTFTAEVRGDDLQSVAWSISRVTPSEVLKETSSPVFGSGGVRISEFPFILPFNDKAGEYRVVATGLTETSKPASQVPAAERVFQARHAPLLAKIEAPGLAFFDRPVTFTLNASGRVKSVVWDFGDGTRDESGVLNPVHRFQKYGRFRVSALVTGAGDSGQVSAETMVTVEPAKPVARLYLTVRGTPVTSVKPGTVVNLVDESSGDIATRTVYLNDKPLTAGVATITLEQRGDHVVRLDLASPPDTQGNRFTDSVAVAIKVRPTPNHLVFVGGTLFLVLMLILLYIAITGNTLRQYYFEFQQPNRPPSWNYQIAEVNWIKWDWLNKAATIPLSEALNGFPGWTNLEGEWLRLRLNHGMISCIVSDKDKIAVDEPIHGDDFCHIILRFLPGQRSENSQIELRLKPPAEETGFKSLVPLFIFLVVLVAVGAVINRLWQWVYG